MCARVCMCVCVDLCVMSGVSGNGGDGVIPSLENRLHNKAESTGGNWINVARKSAIPA